MRLSASSARHLEHLPDEGVGERRAARVAVELAPAEQVTAVGADERLDDLDPHVQLLLDTRRQRERRRDAAHRVRRRRVEDVQQIRVVAELDCAVACEGCDQLHCDRCASDFIEGLCFDCVEENPDWSGEDSEDEW